ncbi:4-hydroxy-tetrahydrodipicolinate reductase [Ruminiclostridium cellobioparum]|jgi:4-hydroxy-tetrahydrodipicolinate reductase|uniref:4-hydroxy-tetrahydrodipicolinate reductase n=1 Tax=Ruminiclostridium cellobioparum subsp. termitidis CT1112 TaxID=1195236 RepID=S0FNE6_RUMCE|nr:4-hydroxy-tetrahydrodipicolinate reductase [Ruminiclostridium cellobioparum]EMS71866.1 dihydrodipicolinate reductase [Ruminiclostridium cellobioparum subsp. termitidis CT1112]
MINVLLSGCNGKMGQVITRLADGFNGLKIAAGFDINNNINNPYPVFTSLKECNVKADVIVDFSNPKAFGGLIEFAQERKIPVVMCTTGLSSEQTHVLKDEVSKHIPVFFSANMSIGVNLLIDLVKKAAKVLEGQFDIEIVEKHHNQKIDAPSGTALAIADAINETLEEKCEYMYDRHSRRKKRGRQEIGIHAVRGGTIVGDHSVIFAGNDEIIEINHTATSKEIFGVGALKASLFLAAKKPGLYSMTDLIAEIK